jgi:putative DNA methylase
MLGHISTLHLWPARRPLAASRAAIAAALLLDPGNDEERKAIVRRLGGELVTKSKTAKGGKTEKDTVTGKGGILWWGTESGPDLSWFRERIKAAYGGRAPRVLDPLRRRRGPFRWRRPKRTALRYTQALARRT